MGINRGAVRSAFDRLGALGLVELPLGAGYQVLDFRSTVGPALLTTWVRTRTAEKELESVFGDFFRVRISLGLR